MCDECRRIIGHDCRCPKYVYPNTYYCCEYCGEGIYENDEYIENDNGNYMHYDCIHGTRELIHWLGYEIETMGEYND